MSLNRSEQALYDYIQTHRDERQFWEQKVHSAAVRARDAHEVAARLEGELWRYFEERSAVASPLKEQARVDGLKKTSMRNLAELLVRLWTSPEERKRLTASSARGEEWRPYA